MKEKDLYIIKVGTQTLVDSDGCVREVVLKEIFESVSLLISQGVNVIIVTSGAVRLGRNVISNHEISKSALASIGQPLMFNAYKKEADAHKLIVSELLLTRSYIIKRTSLPVLQKTFENLFSHNIVPIVNENDAFSHGTDLSFGDNDSLASVLSVILEAKKLVIVSHIDGLFDSDPTKNKNAKLITEVLNVSDEFLKFCATGVSANGSGGMLSKLKAARICSAVGIDTHIVNGLVEGNIRTVCAGGLVGTYLHGRNIHGQISNKERWILAAKSSSGSIQIDDGAVEALQKSKSLLAVGIKKVYGDFLKDEVIELLNKKNNSVAFGIADLSRADIEHLFKTNQTHDQRIIHANNLFILK